jgi:hypothetical protein
MIATLRAQVWKQKFGLFLSGAALGACGGLMLEPFLALCFSNHEKTWVDNKYYIIGGILNCF